MIGGGGAMLNGFAAGGGAFGAGSVPDGLRSIDGMPSVVDFPIGPEDPELIGDGIGGTVGDFVRSVAGIPGSPGAAAFAGGLNGGGIVEPLGDFAIGVGIAPLGALETGTGTGPLGTLPIGGGIVPRSESRDSVETSPITTHSASALTASIRPPVAGGFGRGSAGTSAGRGATLGAGGLSDVRAFSSSASIVWLGSSGARNFTVIPTRPYNTDGVFAELTTSAWPSIITPPFDSASAKRPFRPAGNGSAIGMNITPFRSAYRRNAEMNSSPDVHAETK